jgi:hypothetical protein
MVTNEMMEQSVHVLCPGSGAETCSVCYDRECRFMNGVDVIPLDDCNAYSSGQVIWSHLVTRRVHVYRDLGVLTEEERLDARYQRPLWSEVYESHESTIIKMVISQSEFYRLISSVI